MVVPGTPLKCSHVSRVKWVNLIRVISRKIYAWHKHLSFIEEILFSLMFVALKIEDKKLRGNDDFGGGKVKRGRMEDEQGSLSVFDGCIFCFPSVTCWCEKHNFPIFLLCTYSLDVNLQKRFSETFFSLSYTQFTRQSSSADIKAALYPYSSATANHPRQTKRNGKFSFSKGKRLFTFILVCKKHEMNPYDVDIKRERGYD